MEFNIVVISLIFYIVVIPLLFYIVVISLLFYIVVISLLFYIVVISLIFYIVVISLIFYIVVISLIFYIVVISLIFLVICVYILNAGYTIQFTNTFKTLYSHYCCLNSNANHFISLIFFLLPNEIILILRVPSIDDANYDHPLPLFHWFTLFYIILLVDVRRGGTSAGPWVCRCQRSISGVLAGLRPRQCQCGGFTYRHLFHTYTHIYIYIYVCVCVCVRIC